MKKKSKKKSKQKIDVVLASLLNLEQKMRELIKTVEKLQPDKAPEKKYWPVDYPNYKDVTWKCEQKTQPFFVKHDSN